MRTLSVVATALMLYAVPVQAQLLGGSLGGMIGGGIGIGGLNSGISGSASTAVRTAIRTPQVQAKSAARPAAIIARAPTTAPRVIANVALPAIPNVAVRRTAIIDAGIAPVSLIEVPAYVDNQYVVLQNELRGSGVEVIRRQNQIVLELPSDVTFAFDKSNIQPRFYGALNAVSRTLNKYPATYVDIYGHTDAIGSLAYNQALSERRAGTVADYLADRAVSPARMHVEGFGKTEPIASNATVAGRAANRRVEIVLTPYAD